MIRSKPWWWWWWQTFPPNSLYYSHWDLFSLSLRSKTPFRVLPLWSYFIPHVCPEKFSWKKIKNYDDDDSFFVSAESGEASAAAAAVSLKVGGPRRDSQISRPELLCAWPFFWPLFTAAPPLDDVDAAFGRRRRVCLSFLRDKHPVPEFENRTFGRWLYSYNIKLIFPFLF